MDFAMIESTEEYNSVAYMLQKNGNQEYVILVEGITFTSKSLTEWFFTSTGEKIPFAMTWSPGQPDDAFNKEKCLSIISPSPLYKFNDIPCNAVYPFLCQSKNRRSP